LQEVKETVYIAISAMILALVLSMVAILLEIRSDLADARNGEILAANSNLEYRQFNKYDNNTIYGDEVIELILLYYDTGIDIYVDTPDGASSQVLINEERVKQDPSIINLTELQNLFKPGSEYVSQLVYNAKDPSTVSGPTINKPVGSVVTGVAVEWISNN